MHPPYVHLNDETLQDMMTAKGILLDLRSDGRGSTARQHDLRRIQELAGHFTDVPRIYGYQEPGRLGEGGVDTLRVFPAEELSLSMPVVVLVNASCSVLGTELAMMLQSMPQVTLVGRPTRGTWAAPALYRLPIGSVVNYPSRVVRNAAGTVVNDTRGLVPDILVSPDGSSDPVFEAGLQALRGMVLDIKAKEKNTKSRISWGAGSLRGGPSPFLVQAVNTMLNLVQTNTVSRPNPGPRS